MEQTLSLPFSDDTTSKDAAIRMGRKPSKVKADRARILEYLARYGPATDKEMQMGLGMPGDTQRPRRGEIARRGDIYRTNERRDGSVVWAVKRGESDRV